MDNLDQEEYDSDDELSFHVQEFQWTQLLNYNREYESDSELPFNEHSEYDSDKQTLIFFKIVRELN